MNADPTALLRSGYLIPVCALSAIIIQLQEISMQDNHDNIDGEPGYLSRLVSNDAAKKGAAALLAGVLVAAISEALWPTRH